MNKDYLKNRIDFLLNQGQKVVQTKRYYEMFGNAVDSGLQMGFRTASLSFISNLYGENHPYYKNFNTQVQGDGLDKTESGINILLAIKSEIENDWLISLKQLISSEIFADFLDMSKHLLDYKYKDPAAVMIGSTLEEHLRLLCRNYSVPIEFEKAGNLIPKKANLLNAELVKVDAYGILEQKNVTAWLDLRNRAAHGKYDEYTIEQVNLMYQGVLNFIMTHK
jgi:hypothetical protein